MLCASAQADQPLDCTLAALIMYFLCFLVRFVFNDNLFIH